jgi:hypothetical protein
MGLPVKDETPVLSSQVLSLMNVARYNMVPTPWVSGESTTGARALGRALVATDPWMVPTQGTINNGRAAVSFSPTPTADPAPMTIASMKLWFRSDRGLTLRNGKVLSWDNIAGFGTHNHYLYSQLDSGCPTYTASDAQFNGRPTLTFDGVDDCMDSSVYPAVVAHPFTLYIAMRIVSYVSGSTDYYLSSSDPSGTNETSLLSTTPSSTKSSPYIFTGIGSLDSRGQEFDTTKTQIVCAIFDDTNTSIFVDDYVVGARNGPAASIDLGSMRLGNRYTGANPANFKVAEVIGYAGHHTQSQRQTVMQYMSALYGTTLTTATNREQASEIAAWYDAETSVSPGTANAALNTIGDRSGIAGTLTGSGANRPIYRTAQFFGSTKHSIDCTAGTPAFVQLASFYRLVSVALGFTSFFTFKTSSVVTVSGQPTINPPMALWGGDGLAAQYNAFGLNGNNVSYCNYSLNTYGTYHEFVSSGLSLANGNRHTVAVTHDAGGVITLFADGVQVFTETIDPADLTAGQQGFARIGCAGDTSGGVGPFANASPFLGHIAEGLFWERALSAEDIAQYHQRAVLLW